MIKELSIEEVLQIRKQPLIEEKINTGTYLNVLDYVYELLKRRKFNSKNINLLDYKLAKEMRIDIRHDLFYRILDRLNSKSIIIRTVKYCRLAHTSSRYDIHVNRLLDELERVSLLRTVRYAGYEYKIDNHKRYINIYPNVSTYSYIKDIYSFSISSNYIFPLNCTHFSSINLRIELKDYRKEYVSAILKKKQINADMNLNMEIEPWIIEKINSSVKDPYEKTYIKDIPQEQKYFDSYRIALLNILKEDKLTNECIKRNNEQSQYKINVHCRKYHKGIRIWVSGRQTSNYCGMTSDDRKMIANSLGLINEVDQHGAIFSVEKAINQGFYNPDFDIKDFINIRFADGTKADKKAKKNFVNRLEFTSSLKLIQAQCYKSYLDGLKEPDSKEYHFPKPLDNNSLRMASNTFKAIIGETRPKRIFLYESLIELEVMRIMDEQGIEFINCFDCFHTGIGVDVNGLYKTAFNNIYPLFKQEMQIAA